MITPLDYKLIHTKKRAVFNPKKLDTVRPELLQFVGSGAVWQCCDYGRSLDDPYPGQYRWFAVVDTGDLDGREWSPLDKRFQGYWVPDEDLAEQCWKAPAAGESQQQGPKH